MSIPFTLYGIRHLFATSAIKQGVDLISLADALGHTDLKMLSKVYSHVHLDEAHRAETLKKALGDVA
jgi:integrase